jgi:hypothetical protein
MNQQPKSAAQEALDVLAEAYAYYTPAPRVPSTAPAYEDLPTAA